METLPHMSAGQKILASCGIFLFVAGMSGAYAFSRIPTGILLPEAQTSETLLPPVVQEGMAVPEMFNPQVRTLQEESAPTPVMSGMLVEEARSTQSGTRLNTSTSPSVPAPGASVITAALNANGFATREDLGWDRTIFDRITPYAHLVSMQSYLVFGQAGEQIGRFTAIRALDPEVQDVFVFIKQLAQRDLPDSVSLSEGQRGRLRVFLYNDLDKRENLRIVVQASAQEAYAIDVPAYMQGIVDAALSAL